MQITKDKVAWFHYRMFEGSIKLEDSFEGDPFLYLHGSGGIFEEIEKALEGKQSGDVVDVTLEPRQTYGLRQDMPPQRVPIKHLLQKRQPRKGDVFQVLTENGKRDVVIVKVGKFNVDVDFNHPLAGKTLRFEIEVGKVRDATAEELAHGHAHGAGGHQH